MANKHLLFAKKQPGKAKQNFLATMHQPHLPSLYSSWYSSCKLKQKYDDDNGGDDRFFVIDARACSDTISLVACAWQPAAGRPSLRSDEPTGDGRAEGASLPSLLLFPFLYFPLK